MELIYKQLFKQIVKDKIFLVLLILLTMLTSLSFFFVTFSIDGNMAVLNNLSELTENQKLYKTALNSNTILAYTFLASMTGLAAFVFVMFFYRFFRANKKQIGCMKALGFQNRTLRGFFVVFTAMEAVIGALAGMFVGYYLSDILLLANEKTYGVTGLTKGIGFFSFVMGVVVPIVVFGMTAYLCYGFVKNKEAGVLLSGNSVRKRVSFILKFADKMSKIAPRDKRLSIRIALRKPLSVLLLFTAVMSFSVCIILGQSLNTSSEKIFDSQTKGHNYEYEIRYEEYQITNQPEDVIAYLECHAVFSMENYDLERKVTGLYQINELFELKNEKNELLMAPEANMIYINPEFSEVYGVEIGDSLAIFIEGAEYTFMVKDIAANAKTKNVYMNGAQLAEILGVRTGAYNGIYSAYEISGDDVTNKEHLIEVLNRNAVSNKVSAVINQAVGVLVGVILIFIALYINFQDNTHDMLILNMLGHRTKEIRKMLINVYFPLLWISFAVSLVPSIILARAIQNSLSISTNDYMPFGVNVMEIIAAFVIINLIYWMVQAAFSLGVKRTIAKRSFADIVYVE